MKNKGAAAIIATVMLVMIAIAAAGMMYSWTKNMQGTIQKSTEEKYASDAAKTDAKLNIDSMWNTTGIIEFTLRNTGTYTFEDLTKFSFYVNGLLKPQPASLTGSLLPGGIITITTTESFPLLDNPKTIRLVANTGTSITYKCEITTASQSYC